MRKNLFVACLCALAMTFGAASAALAGSTPGSGIVGSKHDMRLYAGVNGGHVDEHGRVCAYCHTPHHAVEDTDADYMPLWSRAVTEYSNFTPYSSNTFSFSGDITDPVAGPSRLCMGCHDGMVAIDAYYGKPGNALLVEGDSFQEIGVGQNADLSNDHPIGFLWDETADVQGEIAATTAQFQGAASPTTIAQVLYDSDGDGDGDMMTCATCHDVHNGPSVADYWFLYGKQQDSAFCTTCHLK